MEKWFITRLSRSKLWKSKRSRKNIPTFILFFRTLIEFILLIYFYFFIILIITTSPSWCSGTSCDCKCKRDGYRFKWLANHLEGKAQHWVVLLNTQCLENCVKSEGRSILILDYLCLYQKKKIKNLIYFHFI